MANRKFTLSSATKQKLKWLKAQWVNETCRNLQVKVIKTAAFCHNRALQDLYPDSYRLLFITGSFTLRASPLSSAFNVRTCWKDRNLLVLVEYEVVVVCRGALELYYSIIG